MIKGEDLRYGNWVTIDNPNSWPEMKGIPVRVKCIDHQPNLYFPQSDFSIEMDLAKACYAQFNEFVCGIPLTEEILIKAGFEHLQHFTVTNSIIKNIGRNRIISIGSVGTPNEMIWLCEIDMINQTKITDLVCIRNYDYDGGKTDVHQLQNLYYSLTGEELTINF